MIAVDGIKLFGRFDFDFSENTVIDREIQWYEDSMKWEYEYVNNKKVGISICTPLSLTYGGVSTFVYSQTDVSSQYLKHGIEYDWAESYFKDSSWVIARAKTKELVKNVLIKGIDKAQELFTAEEFFEAYLYLCDYRNVFAQGKTESAVRVKLGELLGKLNLRQNVLTGQIFHGRTDESLGRTKIEFEVVLDTILNTESDISTFFIEKDDHSINRDLTFKQWLNFISSKIKSADISKCKNSGIKNVLSWAQTELDKIADLAISDKKYFDTDGPNSELKRGMEMFEIILEVIGHSTFRYVATHGISHNNIVKGIKIGIMDVHGSSQLAPFCDQFAFYPSVMSTAGTGSYRCNKGTLYNHRFSLFFGDSLVYFPIKDGKGIDIRSSKNAYYLDYVLVSYLEDNHRVTQDIMIDLENDFNNIYKIYRDSNLQTSMYDKALMFVKSNSYEVIDSALISVSESMFKSGDFDSISEQLHNVRRAELYLRKGLIDNAKSTTSIRYLLEQAVTQCKSYLELKINGISVSIPLSKFINTPIYGVSSFDISYEAQHLANKKAIDDREAIFRKTIEENPELNGKARFFITLDNNNDGIQYVHITASDTLSKFFNPNGATEYSLPIYVDIDINNDPNHYLEKLAMISMMHQQGPNMYRFGLIMKQVGAHISDPAYFVLNGDSFISAEHIYSESSILPSGTRRYTSVRDLEFVGVVDFKHYNTIINKNYFIYNLYIKYVQNLGWFV